MGHEYLAPLVEARRQCSFEAIKLLEEKGYKISEEINNMEQRNTN